MPGDYEFDDDYRPNSHEPRWRGPGRQRAFLVAVGVLVALALVGWASG